MEVWLIHSVVLIIAVQKSDSVIHTHKHIHTHTHTYIYIPFHTFHYGLSQYSEYSSHAIQYNLVVYPFYKCQFPSGNSGIPIRPFPTSPSPWQLAVSPLHL